MLQFAHMKIPNKKFSTGCGKVCGKVNNQAVIFDLILNFSGLSKNFPLISRVFNLLKL